jgi:hypothetical protein
MRHTVVSNGLVEFVVPVDWPTGIAIANRLIANRLIANRLYVLVGIDRRQRSARAVRLEHRSQVNFALLMSAGPNLATHEAKDASVKTIF